MGAPGRAIGEGFMKWQVSVWVLSRRTGST